jgi:hypothetical protein
MKIEHESRNGIMKPGRKRGVKRKGRLERPFWGRRETERKLTDFI